MYKINIKNYAYSNYKSNQAKKALRKYLPHILNESQVKQIKVINIFLMYNFGKKNNQFRQEKLFGDLFVDGVINISIAPNWIKDGDIDYGIAHELIHVRDIISGKLITEKPKKGESFRAWFKHSDGFHYLYTKSFKRNRFKTDRKRWLSLMKKYYPWEMQALQVNRLISHVNNLQSS